MREICGLRRTALAVAQLLVALLLLPTLAGAHSDRDRRDRHSHWDRHDDRRDRHDRKPRWKRDDRDHDDEREERFADHHQRRRDAICAWLRPHAEKQTKHAKHIRHWMYKLGCEMPDPEPEIPVAPAPLASLLNEAGLPFADLGRVEADGSEIEVRATSTFVDPVVILGPATRRDAEPGMAQLQAVGADAFRVRFAEWAYLDGAHAAEAISYLILEPGRHRLADGSEWEVGTLEISEAGTFFDQAFSAPFAEPPALFLTVQSLNEADPVAVRARAVDENGFQATLTEEEAADGLHAGERVGYLAVVSPAGSGRLVSTTSTLPYLVRELEAGDVPVPMLSGTVAMEEESSADPELGHADETLSFLAIGAEVFAHAMTHTEADPAVVRRGAPEHDSEVEWGLLSGIDENWHTVPLSRSYADPIVVFGPPSFRGAGSGVLRMRNLDEDSFELRYQEWAYLNGRHGRRERGFYLVAERGIQSLGGLILEAGTVETALEITEGTEEVVFSAPFAEMPGVFASVNTENDLEPVTVRITGRSNLGFQLAMQPEEAGTGVHGTERLSWIAIQRGDGTLSDGRRVRVMDAVLDAPVVSVPFGMGVRNRFPVVLSHIVSTLGIDPVVLRFENLDATGVDLVAEEEQSADAETEHGAAEDLSVFIAE